MRRKTALLLSGLVTAFVMVVVVGVIALSGQFTNVAQAAAPGIQAPDPRSTTDVATLQAEAAAYKAALQKADQDLQTAYDQIKTLNNQVQQLGNQLQQLNAQFPQSGRSGFGRGRFNRGGDD